MKIWKLLLLSLLVFGCQSSSEKPTPERPINPNGDSELALLMREMFEESDRIKQQIEAGEFPSGLQKFEAIHSAVPTDSDVSGPIFESMATAYIQSIRAIEAGDSSTVFRFNSMVDQCMNCHAEFCPGPMKRIKKLYIQN